MHTLFLGLVFIYNFESIFSPFYFLFILRIQSILISNYSHGERIFHNQ